MMMGYILEVVIAVLLAVTISYCWKLSRKISALQEGKKELGRFIEDFNSSIKRAEQNINQIREVSTETDKKLVEHIQKARFLANDLSFLMDKGENVAETLEHFINTSRSINKTILSSTKFPTGQSAARPEPKISKPGMMLPPERGEQQQQSRPVPEQSMTPSKKYALDNVLAQIAARKAHANSPSTPNKPSAQKPADKPKITGIEEVFDRQRLAESLKATQRMEQ